MQKVLLLLLPLALAGWWYQSGSAGGQTAPVSPEELVGTISHGESVNLEDYVTPEGLTVFEFGADW